MGVADHITVGVRILNRMVVRTQAELAQVIKADTIRTQPREIDTASTSNK